MKRLLCLLLLVACGDDDESGADASGVECSDDSECSDGVFCGGIERCVEGQCEPGEPPCPAPLLCDESEARCASPGCDVSSDADGDGSESAACGGADCDDADPDRYPGNPERCDDVDQDCDPSTFGDTDEDGDGHVSSECCDGVRCGGDCDDSDPAVSPTATEACEGLDNDCDGSIDEGVQRAFYPDLDGDNFGDANASATFGCQPGEELAENALDCDDSSSAVNPTALELCNGSDDNCNGAVDDADATALSCTSFFGSPPNTFFSCEDAMCIVSDCRDGYADCNDEPSDGCETNLRDDLENCGSCGSFCGVGGSCDNGSCDAVSDVSAGGDFTCVVRSPSGRVVCWGNNSFGQLGDFSTTHSETPVVVGPVRGAMNVETFGMRSGSDSCPFTCAQTSSLVYCWGCNRFGQMGDGDPEERNLMSEPVNGVPPVDESILPGLTVGGGHACTQKEDDATPAATLCWGSNLHGQITSASCTDDLCEANILEAASPPDLVSAGLRHTCFLIGTTAYCRGANGDGQLGDGTQDDAMVRPVLVSGGHDFVSIVAGARSTCGARDDGAVLCWGYNGSGELGDGTNMPRLVPTPVSGITDAVQVALGRVHACAVLSDGTARCWGDGALGQLGHGETAITSTPMEVDLTGIQAITCGSQHTCALDDAGDVWCWGFNNYGQAGDTSAGPFFLSPVRVEAI